MGGLERRLRYLEKRAGMDAADLAEAANLVVTEALTRVTTEDLRVMAAVAERELDGDEEWARVLAEEAPEVWRRFEALCEEVADGR